MNRKERRAAGAAKGVAATLTDEELKALKKRADEVIELRTRLLQMGVVPEVELEKHALLAALQKAREKSQETASDIVVAHKLDPKSPLDLDMDAGVIRKR